jgi:DNA-binding response OmpR family regulator
MATILYVDDDPKRLELLPHRLEKAGHAVTTAQNGRAGLNLFQQTSYDLAIVDYRMPGMDGGEVAYHMRRLKPGVPIIIFSGLLTLPERVMAIVDGFISAGDEPEALFEEVDKLTKMRLAS